MNSTIDLLKSHSSVRKFTNKKIEAEMLNEILTSAQAASTSSFMQAYTIIKITDDEKRKSITKLAGDQSYIEECPVFLIFCADLHKFEIACNMNNHKMALGYTEAFIIATIDASLSAQNALIAAEALGLGGVYIGGIRNNPYEISKILNLPENVYAVFGMCLGYPAEKAGIKLRLPLEVVCCENEYDVDMKIDLIKKYDNDIRTYYTDRTKGLRNDTWTGQMTAQTSKPLRPHMKGFLNRKGFLKK
jgi:nitroreductase